MLILLNSPFIFNYIFQTLHIHITDATCRLLDRKIYEVQECSKLTLNGNASLSTYFVLHKKDRAGNVQQRPFHKVLREITREEAELAKFKQTANTKSAETTNHVSSTPKTNGVSRPTPPNKAKSVESPEIQLIDDNTAHSTPNSLSKIKIQQDSTVKSVEHSDTPDTNKSVQRQSHSKTCIVL